MVKVPSWSLATPHLSWVLQNGQDLDGRGRHAVLTDKHEQKRQRVGRCSHGQKRGCMGRSMKNSLERHVRALS